MLTFLASVAMMAASQPISGNARAGDGDSLTVGATRIRLFGIDAPELNQICQRGGKAWSCGQAAAEQLSTLVAGHEVRCIPVGADQHDRVLARCTAGHVDVNRTMVATGYAVAFRRYSLNYVSAEESAKVARRGLWSGTFVMPAEVRAQARSSAVAPQTRERPVRSARKAAAAGGACRIKGNHSRRGEWIYHVPGMPYYEQTRPEAMFCTEAEARAAGYRRAVVK